MSGMNAVTSYFIGQEIGRQIAGPGVKDNSADIAVERARQEVEQARHDAEMAGRSMDNQAKVLGGIIEVVKGAIALKDKLAETEENRDNWRTYAARLRVNLNVRKMSEHLVPGLGGSTLLEALKQENVNHPLATAEGFEAKFQEMLAEQYGVDDVETTLSEMSASTTAAQSDRAAARKIVEQGIDKAG